MCYRISLFHLSNYKSGIKMQEQGNIWSVLEAELYITVIVICIRSTVQYSYSVRVKCLRSRTVHYSCSVTWWSSKCHYKLRLRINWNVVKYTISFADKLFCSYVVTDLHMLFQKEFQLVLTIMVSEDFHETYSEILWWQTTKQLILGHEWSHCGLQNPIIFRFDDSKSLS